MNYLDAEIATLGLDLGLLGAALTNLLFVVRHPALMGPCLTVKRLCLYRQIGHYSAVACWITSLPKRSLAAAVSSSSAVNSKDRPAGAPLMKAGSGLALW